MSCIFSIPEYHYTAISNGIQTIHTVIAPWGSAWDGCLVWTGPRYIALTGAITRCDTHRPGGKPGHGLAAMHRRDRARSTALRGPPEGPRSRVSSRTSKGSENTCG